MERMEERRRLEGRRGEKERRYLCGEERVGSRYVEKLKELEGQRNRIRGEEELKLRREEARRGLKEESRREDERTRGREEERWRGGSRREDEEIRGGRDWRGGYMESVWERLRG